MLLIFLYYETRFVLTPLRLKTPANRAFFTPQPVKRIAECTEVSNNNVEVFSRLRPFVFAEFFH